MRRFVVFALLVAATSLQAEDIRFDPLSRDELRRVVQLLIESRATGPDTRIARVTRVQPDKSQEPHRRARVIALLDGESAAIDIDLDRNSVSFSEPPGGQAPITGHDWARANEALRSDPGWIAALALRDITDPNDVFCESLSAGYFDRTPSAEARVLRLPCYVTDGADTNIYGRPIEGLIATVDLKTNSVVDILDEGARRIPAPAAQLPLAEASAVQPPDSGLHVDGHRITFGPWSLHAGMDDQFGLSISDVTFLDGTEARKILHNSHVSEVFVPYMDPAESWAFRTYLDAGEFGLGRLVSPLVSGVDCPASAANVASHTLSPTARIVSQPAAICVFAEPLRGPVWRHFEALNGLSAGAAGKALVIRSISSIAHYDYIFDWIFGPSGEIEIRIGATGIDAVKAIEGTNNAPEGNRVSPDLIAVFHDHFFSIRLDIDIDGAKNTLVRETFVPIRDRNNPLARSYWRLKREPTLTEGPLSPQTPGLWRVKSEGATGPFGQTSGYQIIPDGTVSMLHPEDSPQRRGAFSAAPIWVTRYASGETAASGTLPNQHQGKDGLPSFANGEPVISSDLVLWPTIGFRHVTRVEDWPALSVVWKSVQLRPYGFFDGNPAILDR